MTVSEIKEYIDKHTKGIYVKYETVDFVRLYDAMLKVRSMLDELEPKAKWKHDNSKWKYRFICSKCGHKIFEEQQPYCSNCGARMNDEVDDGSKD